jgi:hypothetical protein
MTTSENYAPENYAPGNYAPQKGQAYGQPYPAQSYGQPMPGVPAHAQYAQPTGPIGQVRSTGVTILLFVVTFGIWSLVYYYQTHEEMKRHTGEGIGGVLALVLGFFVGFVSPFLHSHEVGGLYERRGQRPPVGAATGLWYLPGIVILVGPIIWFVKTNGALNAYWRSVGAR